MTAERIAKIVTRIECDDSIEELARMAQIKALGYVPSAVGDAVPVAPARGSVRMFDMKTAYTNGKGEFECMSAGHKGRKTLQRADSFDVMVARAARHDKPSPFKPDQIAMGRFYRDLVERYES